MFEGVEGVEGFEMFELFEEFPKPKFQNPNSKTQIPKSKPQNSSNPKPVTLQTQNPSTERSELSEAKP
jgi:hypothetical protein